MSITVLPNFAIHLRKIYRTSFSSVFLQIRFFSEKSAFHFSHRAAPAISFRARFFFDGKTRFLHRFVISRLKINDILIYTLMMGEVCHVPNEIQPP